MLRMITRIALTLLLAVLFITASPDHVYACTFGAPPPFEPQLETGIAIIGEVVETDYMGQNMLVRVESYLTDGAGAEYVVVVRNRPVRVEGVLDGQLGGGDCNFIEPTVEVGEQGFMFLGRSYFGYYYFINSSLLNSNGTYAYVLPDEPTAELSYYVACDDCDNEVERVETTYESFLAFISEVTGDTPTEPLPDAFIPTTQQLLITTSTGTDYILPIDAVPEPVEMTFDNLNNWMRLNFSGVMENYVDGSYNLFGLVAGETCTDFECIALADNGTQFAFTTTNGNLRLPYGYELAGDRASFSPDGRLIVVWDDDLLTVYELNYREFLLEQYGTAGEPPQITPLLEVTLDDATRDADVVWSDNGRSLAYSTPDGLWLWDTWFPDTEPRVLMPPNEAGEIAFAQYFSPVDEFLTLLNADRVQTMDLRSGELMVGGVVSPLQTTLVTPSEYPIELVSIRDAIADAGSVGNWDIPEVVWLDESRFAWLSNVAGGCVYHTQQANQPIIRDFEYYEMFLCTASLLTRDYWVIANQQTVMINGTMIDLTGLLDGDIVGLRWLPSLMYDGWTG